jgi:hypothetical protein
MRAARRKRRDAGCRGRPTRCTLRKIRCTGRDARRTPHPAFRTHGPDDATRASSSIACSGSALASGRPPIATSSVSTPDSRLTQLAERRSPVCRHQLACLHDQASALVDGAWLITGTTGLGKSWIRFRRQSWVRVRNEGRWRPLRKILSDQSDRSGILDLFRSDLPRHRSDRSGRVAPAKPAGPTGMEASATRLVEFDGLGHEGLLEAA